MNDLEFVGYEKIMISLTRNDYEPDLCYFCKEVAEHFTAHQTLFPAPDFIVDMLSESIEDRDVKFNDYQAHGVKEYWIIDPETKVVELYHLQNGNYVLVKKTDEGMLCSEAIDGFCIPAQAILDEKVNQVFLINLLNNTL